MLRRLLIVCSLLLAHGAFAATTHFVRSGASGNGSTWANAWANPGAINWGSVAAGDTICIAGGTYSGGTGSIVTGANGTTTAPITIKRAYGPDATCGSTTAGWSSSFDAQVTLAGGAAIVFQNNFITVDGMVWNGLRVLFAVSDCQGVTWNECFAVSAVGATTNITIRNVEEAGPCNGNINDPSCMSQDPNNTGNWDTRGIFASAGGSPAENNWLIQYNNVHGFCDGIDANNNTNLIIEHSRIADIIARPATNGYTCHDNFFITNGTNAIFRYNEVTNWHVEGFLIGNTAGASTSNLEIYGNVFHDPATADGNTRLLEAQEVPENVKFYNNTIVNVNAGVYCAGTVSPGSWGTVTAYNNLYYGNFFATCGLPGEDYAASNGTTGQTHGQNGLTSAIFQNYAAKTVAGYNLAAHTTPGITTLGSPYNIDYNGNTRTTWDRGFTEYINQNVWFVKSGGTGNGSSWANAWGNVSSIVWSNLANGGNVCVAGGTYSGGIVPSTSGSATFPITIKRALAADPVCGSTTAGWQAAFDAQVVIPNGILVNAVNNITIDGMVWNGISTTTTASQCTGGNDCIGVEILGPASNITLRNIESAGPCGSTPCTYNGVFQSVRIGHNFQPVTNFLLQYVNMHGGCDNLHLIQGTGTIEYSRFADSVNNNTGCHENVIEGGEGGVTVTMRYSEWVNWGVEGIMMCPTSPGCGADNWTIYGNIFHDAGTWSFPRFLAFQNSTSGIVLVYNNSFINAGSFGCYSAEGGTPSTGSFAKNNIYFGSGFHACGFPSSMPEDYGASDGATGMTNGQNNLTSAYFVNYAAKTVAGYNLAQHTNPGFVLGSPYNVDENGNTRNNPDRGFVEFVASSSNNFTFNPTLANTVAAIPAFQSSTSTNYFFSPTLSLLNSLTVNFNNSNQPTGTVTFQYHGSRQ